MFSDRYAMYYAYDIELINCACTYYIYIYIYTTLYTVYEIDACNKLVKTETLQCGTMKQKSIRLF